MKPVTEDTAIFHGTEFSLVLKECAQKPPKESFYGGTCFKPFLFLFCYWELGRGGGRVSREVGED